MTKRKTKKGQSGRTTATGRSVERWELNAEELQAVLARTKVSALSEPEHEMLETAIKTLVILTQELEAKDVSIKRLRDMLFGPSTEKTSLIVGKGKGESEQSDKEGASNEDESKGGAEGEGSKGDGDPTGGGKRRKGHGRNGSSAYTGAEKKKVSHESLKPGDICPECETGKLYEQKPVVLIRVKGMAPLSATAYELGRLRCNGCGEVFTAEAPEGVGEERYDETAASMIAVLKYGCGLPFSRLERLESSLGIPLPATTQWDEVHKAYQAIVPAYEELIRQAANGEVIHNDDTTMKILELMKPGQAKERENEGKEDAEERTGVNTSGIVSVGEGRQIAVFFTGRKHAGENLSEVLKERAAGLDPPIQMCDASSRNTKGTDGSFETVLANCLAHGRRKFVEVMEYFPEECCYVLETLREVYHNDDLARERNMTQEERLRFHQEQSGPWMEKLRKWFDEQFDERKVEPNSGLGKAIKYMRKHWSALTLFLRVPGAPLDNTICERAIKKAILHRKNAMFFKTQNGAQVGDAFMSLIYTCELCRASPFDYLVALQRNSDALKEQPSAWTPWNFKKTLERLSQLHDSPP